MTKVVLVESTLGPFHLNLGPLSSLESGEAHECHVKRHHKEGGKLEAYIMPLTVGPVHLPGPGVWAQPRASSYLVDCTLYRLYR